MPPKLIIYKTEVEYRNHYENNYCRESIFTYDGIRVFFGKNTFFHAFYKTLDSGRKGLFDEDRAKRIDWIKAVLGHKDANHYQGYHKKSGVIPERRVSVVFESYVVIISFYLNEEEVLAAKFITAFYINPQSKTLEKIKKSPYWNKEMCVKNLKKKNGR